MKNILFTYLLVSVQLILHNALASQHDAHGDNNANGIIRSSTLSSVKGLWINDKPPRISTLSIERQCDQYSQVRLDFRTLILDGPNAEGICTTNTISFTGQLKPIISPLCGNLTGQHVYLNFDCMEDINITIVPSSQSSWLIEVTQLRNTDDLFAPEGCLQYHKRPLGLISSFGFNGDRDNDLSTTQIANLNYNICFDDSAVNCRLTLGTTVFSGLTNEELHDYLAIPSLVPADQIPPILDTLTIPNPQVLIPQQIPFEIPFGFSISGIEDVNGANYLTNILFNDDCLSDYLQMGVATYLGPKTNIQWFPPPDLSTLAGILAFVGPTVDRIPINKVCGYLQDGFTDNLGFGESFLITKTVKPFTISVVTNGGETPTDNYNKGFRFLYNLASCP